MRAAATITPSDFVDRNFLYGEAYAFDEDPVRHRAFRAEVGYKLSVPEDQVCLIGSGKLGFSLNKDHLLRLFSPESDLDLVVAAQDLFDSTHLELVRRSRELALASQDERRRLRKSRETIFHGYLRPDQLPMTVALSQNWFPRIAGPYVSEVARRHPVKAWLFKSLEHARLCYQNYIEEIQPSVRRLLANRGDF